ncbi:MAG: Cyclic dehypoxanthine futalosine synthase [Phycisphaerales bacterium]|nr:Cyclic dehypoxanthine futalosine synthase [Phycisphaerales bacterium]
MSMRPVEHPTIAATDPGLLAAVVAGEARLTPDQGLELFRRLPLAELGRYADARCRRLHGDVLRTYVIDRNINYTNVCTARCTFCAFRRDSTDHDAYTLGKEAIHEKIAQLVAIGGTQILMQGGMNPDLPLDYYLELLSSIRERFPSVHVHAFSPPELIEFVNFFDPPGKDLFAKCRWVLGKLQEAGLDSLPGGGGEIFATPVRRKIGLGKCDAESWLTVMFAAHSLGMFTSATMMFGHIEGHADRVHHMWLVRQWQDRALAEAGRDSASAWQGDTVDSTNSAASSFGHYKAFISWPFQRENTPLGRVRDWGAQPEELSAEFPGDIVARAFDWGRHDEVDYRALGPAAEQFGRRVRMSGASDYLRTQALSRLFLDNIFSIGSSWVTMGPHIGQVGLAFGANDMGSVMMEENVVSAAGTTYFLDEALLCRLIRESGFIPAQRDNTYDLLNIHDGQDSPDLRVKDWSTHRAKSLSRQRGGTSAARESEPVALTVTGAAERSRN